MYYIYALIDPRSSEPFYVGKGKHGSYRHLDHFSETITESSNRHKVFKINYLRKHGYEISVKILQENIDCEEVAYNIETAMIKKFGRKNIDPGGILTNICLDNRPPNQQGKKQSPEHIQRRVRSYQHTCKTKGRKPHSAETKAKLREASIGEKNSFYGRKHTTETKKAHSQRMKGNKNNSKTYLFISPGGERNLVHGRFYEFCVENDLAISTMEKALKNGTTPKNGKCAGWRVERYE